MNGRIALININWAQFDKASCTDTTHPPICQPIEFGYLSNELKSMGYECVLCDAYRNNWNQTQLKERLQCINDLVAVVISTAPSMLYWRCPPLNIKYVAKDSKFIKKSFNVPVFVIGPHATISPEWLLDLTGADYVFGGNDFYELADSIHGVLSSAVTDFSNGIIMQKTPYNDAKFSLLDYSLFEGEDYGIHYWDRDIGESFNGISKGLILETSRGCPFSCYYCFKRPLRDKHKRKPIELVETELQEAKRRGIQYIYFIDEIFNCGCFELKEVLSIIKKTGILFGCQARPDLFDEEMIDLFSDSGCVYVELGVDCNDTVLSRYIQRTQDIEYTEAMIEYTKKKIAIVRFNRLNFTTDDYCIALNQPVRDWEFPADPIYPYPNTYFGDVIMKQYHHESYSWGFASKYLLWLRVEVFLQRRQKSIKLIRLLKWVLLALPEIFLSFAAKKVYNAHLVDDLRSNQKDG